METTSLRCYDCPKGLHAIVFLLVMLSISTQSVDAMTADLAPQHFRVSVAADNVKNDWQYAVAYQLRPPRRLRARHLELAIGAIAATSQTHAFVSLGPVWQLPLARGNDRWLMQLGFSPTLLTGSTINGRDMGGKIHFTSSASFGATLGEQRTLSIALRVQHMSNGGINRTNPGLDMIGLTLSYDFDR